MPDLTTRDVFQQIDARLTRVEDELRALRREMNERLKQLEERMDRGFREAASGRRWILGLLVTNWLTTVGAILYR